MMRYPTMKATTSVGWQHFLLLAGSVIIVPNGMQVLYTAHTGIGTYAAHSNEKRKPRRFSLICSPFAHRANRTLSLSIYCRRNKWKLSVKLSKGKCKFQHQQHHLYEGKDSVAPYKLVLMLLKSNFKGAAFYLQHLLIFA